MYLSSDSPQHLRLNPRSVDFAQNPYQLYAELHANGRPVFWEDYGFWCVSDYDSVNNILRDKSFARLPPPGYELPAKPSHLREFEIAEKYSLLALEPPDHTRLRKAVNRAFSYRQIQSLTDHIRQECLQALTAMKQKADVDLLVEYATPIPVNVITHMLGVDQKFANHFLEWSHAMVKVYTLTQTYEEEISANQAAAQFQEFLRHTIRNAATDKQSSLLLSLLQCPGQEGLTEDELISTAILLLNAGHEATVHQIGNAVNTLLHQFPISDRATLLDILRDDSRTDNLVSECLRYDAPLHLFTRYAQSTVRLDDTVRLSPGEEVGLLLGAANRCPTRFNKPDAFIPERADKGHVSLGAGIHHCIGAHLAKLEMKIVLQELFNALPELELAENSHYQNSFHFHGLAKLKVKF